MSVLRNTRKLSVVSVPLFVLLITSLLMTSNISEHIRKVERTKHVAVFTYETSMTMFDSESTTPYLTNNNNRVTVSRRIQTFDDLDGNVDRSIISPPSHHLRKSNTTGLLNQDRVSSDLGVLRVAKTHTTGVCRTSMIGPLEQLDWSSAKNVTTSPPFVDFLAGSALQTPESIQSNLSSYDRSKDAAVCSFRQDLLHHDHFPHAMQQLYRCLSWWLAHPHLPPVLVYDTTKQIRNTTINTTPIINMSNPFLHGILQAFYDVLNVTTVAKTTLPLVRLKAHRSYCMQTRETDASTFRDRIIRYYNISSVDSTRTRSNIHPIEEIPRDRSATTYSSRTKDPNSIPPLFPRIGILNRKAKDKRNIVNVRELQQGIEFSTYHMGSSNNNVTIEYFSNKTFLQQVEFFNNHDIILSPHGAQLTGIPFMPTCGIIIELFPKGYYLPQFFGSLAYSSNIQHAFFYLAANYTNAINETRYYASTVKLRRKARDVSLCVPVTQIVNALQRLLVQWRQCYHNQFNYVSPISVT
jgi:Glycosyltransferase 61